MHQVETIVGSAMRRMGHVPSPATSPAAHETFILALSGGPDSVALLRALLSLGYDVHAAHCNFHLRGDESDRDEDFCKTLCEKLHVSLHIIHFDTFSYASLHKVSIEMAARELRYRWFTQLAADIKATAVGIAHHQDDQVETVLLNLLRGTGLKGLMGMQQEMKLHISNDPLHDDAPAAISFLRPMLGANEAQIMDYLKELGQDYVIDSTNLEDDAQRNKLRLDIIPLLEKVNPAVKRNIIRMTENLTDIDAIVEESLNRAKEKAALTYTDDSPFAINGIRRVDMTAVNSYPAPLTLLWSLLAPLGFNRPQVTEIASSTEDNKEWTSPSSILIRSHQCLTIASRQEWEQPIPTFVIPEEGLYNFMGRHIRLRRVCVSKDFQVSKSPYRVCLDADAVHFPLTLRAAKAGDRLTPFGMHGSKLVSDFLKDRKRNIVRRHRQLVLTDTEGNILWLVGETISEKYKINPHTSTGALVIEIE